MSERVTGVVTGAGSGLGREIALLAASAGRHVFVADRDLAGAEGTVRLIESTGGSAQAVIVDVTSEDSVAALFADVDRRGRGLAWAVNNAGIHPDDDRLADLDLAAFDRIMAVNARGVALCLKYEMRAMQSAGTAGRIVNIGSTRSFRAISGSAAYVASKFAVIGLTETAALEGGPYGIRVNCVCPGVMSTPMVRARREGSVESEAAYVDRVGGVLGRIGSPDEVAEAVEWLISDASSYVTGHTLVADGGYRIR
ncbi:SDR family NAD(P)-dependent oxidoreductase [Microbacterium sp. CPCC 204701]|uniref:SDR family NAD(P)-dependent oxidoreductase n=1 Tax=Microbacterium sp. CPCC 204701 TaxID=2493084 RepID=UPI001F0CA17D|nr:SDR family NAD(P)-dependent oxidoreductase [Microbacterium sp. CPCC 204701]